MNPEQFYAHYRAERDKWGKAIKDTGMDKNQGLVPAWSQVAAAGAIASIAGDLALEHNPIGLNRKRNGGDSQRLAARRVSSD